MIEELPEKIIAAAKLAGAHDFIMSLPFGYNTMIGKTIDEVSPENMSKEESVEMNESQDIKDTKKNLKSSTILSTDKENGRSLNTVRLSRGERQRISIARGLVNNPPF